MTIEEMRRGINLTKRYLDAVASRIKWDETVPEFTSRRYHRIVELLRHKEQELAEVLAKLPQVPVQTWYEDGRTGMDMDLSDKPAYFISREMWEAFQYHQLEAIHWDRIICSIDNEIVSVAEEENLNQEEAN